MTRCDSVWCCWSGDRCFTISQSGSASSTKAKLWTVLMFFPAFLKQLVLFLGRPKLILSKMWTSPELVFSPSNRDLRSWKTLQNIGSGRADLVHTVCTVSCIRAADHWEDILLLLHLSLPSLPLLCCLLICLSLPLNHTDSSVMSGCRNLLCNLRVGVYMHAYVLLACRPIRTGRCLRVFPRIVCVWERKPGEVCFFRCTPASSPFTSHDFNSSASTSLWAHRSEVITKSLSAPRELKCSL